MSQIACVAIVRNEERHIAEWLAWQFALGFDHVLLLDNLSTDATRTQAACLSGLGGLEILTWPQRGADYQLLAYEFALRHLRGRFEWVAFFDTDEFLVLDPGLTLKGCLRARDEAAAIVIPWAIFGSSGHRNIPDGLVTERFTRRAPASFWPNRHVKSIVRPERFRGLQSVHKFIMDGRVCFLDGSNSSWAASGHLDCDPDYRLGKLHHYFTRSRAHWADKLRRGYPDLVREDSAFDVYDRNEVFDNSAFALLPAVRALLASARPPAPAIPPCLGIAITTFNRRDMVCDLVSAIASLTTSPYKIVVCDDGSEDGTAQALAKMGVRVISGANRGVAWNKNRGLYHLMHLVPCEVILLLDDDIAPTLPGWEHEWIAAARRFGHVNYALPAFSSSLLSGALTAADPGVSTTIPGCALAFSRIVLAQIGYFDLRFGRYGHEHSDMSHRAVRAGFGGVEITEPAPARTGFFVIGGGLALLPSLTSGTAGDLARNGALLAKLGAAPIHRHAWESDIQMAEFLGELQTANPHLAIGRQGRNYLKIVSSPELIFDIGMSEGNDTAFYLAKGFRVVGVEPDVEMYYALQSRFAVEIAAGSLIVHNAAACARYGDIVEFFHHATYQGLSGLSANRAEFALGYRSYHVTTINWPALIERHGLPHYVKIDIDGGEAVFLGAVAPGARLPEYISVKCHAPDPVQVLFDLGYRLFKLVDPNPPGGFGLPNPQAEGHSITGFEFNHASGPFGRDLPGDWLDFQSLLSQWRAARPGYGRTWFDCHAWMPG